MSRRVTLPGASELFRPTGTEAPTPRSAPPTRSAFDERAVEPVRHLEEAPSAPTVAPAPVAAPQPVQTAAGQPSGGTGRVRHDEKITVYVSRDELLALEQARLRLRGDLGLAVDRGRLVRAAIAYALADLESAGGDGELVRRLTAP